MCILSGVISESELKRNLQDLTHQIFSYCSVFELFIVPSLNMSLKFFKFSWATSLFVCLSRII